MPSPPACTILTAVKEMEKTLAIREETLPGEGSRAIFCRACLPDHPRALVLIVHGLHEHSGRYQEAMAFLGIRGVASWAPDCVGHGRSPGVPGDLESLDRVIADIERVRARAVSSYPRLPLFVLGHSLGGLIALRYALEHQRALSGLVLSAPLVLLPETAHVPVVLQKIVPILARLLPRLPVQPFAWQDETRDPRMVADTAADPLYYKGKVRARTGHEMLRSMALAQPRFAELLLPLLVMYGGQDRTVDPRSAERVFAEARSADRTRRVFPDTWHHLFREPEKGQVLETIAEWIASRS